MANLTPTPVWGDVFQLEKETPVLGGAGGVANRQAQELANRTQFLYENLGAEFVPTYTALRAYTGDATRIQIGGRNNYFDGAGGVFVRTGSAADNDGTVLVDALGRSWERQHDGGVDPKWFGADPTASAALNTAAIQAAADYCEASGWHLQGFPGDFSTNGTITLKCSGDLSMMTLHVNAAAVSKAVQVGPAATGQYLFDVDLKLPFVNNTAKTGAGWTGFENSIGVEIANVYQSRITVPSVRNFGIGLQEGGYGVGCVYNTITIGVLYGNKINQLLRPGNATGWVNQNTHIGGRFAYSSTEGTAVSGVVQIQTRSYDAATNNPPDTNTWVSPCVEGNEPAFHLDIQGKFNQFINPRLETFSPTLAKINYHADTEKQTNSNLIFGGYIIGVTYSASGAGSSVNNQWLGTRSTGVMDFSGSGYNTRNTSGDNVGYPHFQGFTSAVIPLGKDQTATNWTYRVFSQGFAVKQPTDSHPRVVVDYSGYVFFGSGTSALAGGLRYNSTPGVLSITSNTNFAPDADNTLTLGTANRRWSVVYAGAGAINTSDEREKQDISAMDAAEKRVAVALKGMIKKFRFKDAVQQKGDDARIHVGVIAQEVIAAFEAEGLDPMRYAIVCYDEWDEQPEVSDDDGSVIVEYRPAGNRYGIRYDELLAFIIATL